MRIQGWLPDPILVQKVKLHKSKLEEVMGMKLSWSAFWSKVVREWVAQQDKEENFMKPILEEDAEASSQPDG